jgi:hypothetical protein
VTGPNRLAEQGAVVQQLIHDANKLWLAAAEQSDSADGLGIDGRISLVHGLCDLWVKTYVAWLEAFIKSGGVFLPGPPLGSKPLPSEAIEVAPQPYPRKIECLGPFARVGLPKVTIPPTAVTFDPPFLPAGLTEIRIVLNDYRFIGSNFVGKIKLTNMSTAANLAPENLVPDEKVVTVGL